MIKKTILSFDQNRAANPNDNVWVQANAGTGKTSVLVQRLLRILFRTPDCTQSGILCLTYTNAGAGEMRNRILRALREWATASDNDLRELLDGITINKPVTDADIAHAREIFFYYIDNPNILKIKTIHGFCEEILHRFPIEAGLSPSWTLVSDASQRVLLQETFDRMINSPKHNDNVYSAFEHIVGRVSENYMTELLSILSNQYKQFFQVKDFHKYRKHFIDTTYNFLDLSNKPNTDFDPEKLKNIINCAKSDKKPAQYLDKIINFTQQYINNTINFEKYKTAYLTNEQTKRSTVSKKEYLVDEQNRIFEINQHNINLRLFNDTIALFDLSAAFANEYKQMKHSRNVLDFEDLILYTRKLFSNPETMGWVLSQLDLSLSHILVDEAQDTSPLQWDILRMLAGDFFADGDTPTDTHSMFVVGDTKQSIYGFQGADPNAFATSRTTIASQIQNNMRTIQEIPLTQSFRSTKAILGTVDKFFSDTDVINISNFSNNTHKCFRTDAPGAVEIHKLISKQTDEVTVTEYVRTVADKIKSLIDSGKYAAKDIMVLVQQRHPMAAPLVSELKRKNIEVAGSDRIILPNFPAIRDLLNLVRFCITPDDDFSLCCVLKSPMFYLTERDIFDLCQIKNDAKNASKTPNQKPITRTIFSILSETHPDIYKQLTTIQKWSKSMAPYTFFSNVLDTNHTRENFVAALGNQVIDPLEEFMTICLAYERTQPGTLYHFIKWFITGGSEIKRDMDASSGVRIVTVHGSKGLESPVVFLIDTIRTPTNDDILQIPSSDPDMPVWLWAPRGEGSQKHQSAANNAMSDHLAVYYRLLYVAMTRARDELYIYGHTPNKNPPDNAWHTHLWRVFGNDTPSEHIRITNDDIK